MTIHNANVHVKVNSHTLYVYVHFINCEFMINESMEKEVTPYFHNCAFDKCHFNVTREKVFRLCFEGYFEGDCTFADTEEKKEMINKDTFNHVDEILSIGRGSLLEVIDGFEVSAMSYLGTEVTKLLPAGTRIRMTWEVSEETLAIKGLAALEEVSLRVTIPVEQWHLLKVTKKRKQEKRDEQPQKQNHILFDYGTDDSGG